MARASGAVVFPRLPTRRVLGEAWDIYRRELLVALPSAVVARVSVVLAATLVVELPLVLLHLVGSTVLSEDLGGGRQLVAEIGLAGLYASLGHHFLQGVLERVVGAERHGHDRPTLREVFRGLPWVRLLVADVVLSILLTALLLAFVLPRILLGPFFVCVMPLLSMRHEDLRSVWGASFRLVRGSWLAVLVALAVVVVANAALVDGVSYLATLAFENHLVESAIHGLVAVLVLPFAALVPVVITFDLLELHGEVPEARH